MIENTFRRLALAQGLLPNAAPLLPADATNEAGFDPDQPPANPADNPAMADQHTQAA